MEILSVLFECFVAVTSRSILTKCGTSEVFPENCEAAEVLVNKTVTEAQMELVALIVAEEIGA
jgi:hypothetical protein